MQVRDVMTTEVTTVHAGTPFKDVVVRLLDTGVSSLPVVDGDGHVIGLVTEADLISKEAYGGRRRRALSVLVDGLAGGVPRWTAKSGGLTAGEVMTTDVVTAAPDDDVHEAARRMLGQRIKRLPVLDDDGRLAGIVSRQDLLRVFGRGDDEIAGELRELLSDPVRVPEGQHVDIDVDHGVVTLSGRVQFTDDARVLDALVWRVPGVVAVRDATLATEAEPHVSMTP